MGHKLENIDPKLNPCEVIRMDAVSATTGNDFLTVLSTPPDRKNEVHEMKQSQTPPESAALDAERLVSFTEFKMRAGVGNSTFYKLRREGALPPEVRLGGRGFFLSSDVRRFFENLKSAANA